MGTRNRYARLITLLGLIAGTFLGCNAGDGGSGTFEVGLTSSGQSLTQGSASDAGGSIDAATPGPRLLLNVRRVDVHMAGDDDDDPPGPGGMPSNDGREGGWITVFSGVAQLDLFQAGSVETFLASAPVPA